jgi:acetyl-CoA carboxylase biotin carboxyl carrier protein
MLKVQEIREIIKLIDQSSITEFNYESDGATVSLRKGTSAAGPAAPAEPPAQTEVQRAPAPAENQETAPVKQPEREQEATETEAVSAENSDFDAEVVSPMVGTFYAAPSPEDDPYVSVGSSVEPQTVVCIVEAMKLFNEIEAEVSGEIVEVLAENGELVEYGQPLFRVKKK